MWKDEDLKVICILTDVDLKTKNIDLGLITSHICTDERSENKTHLGRCRSENKKKRKDIGLKTSHIWKNVEAKNHHIWTDVDAKSSHI